MREHARVALFELLLLTTSVGCKHPRKLAQQPPALASAPAAAKLLAPRAAGPFVCSAGKCRQAQPRLPDSGEWRCADGGNVVWCAGGEPAAGVVSGPADPRFRCGSRWGKNGAERVCIDERPDYPPKTENYRCGFDQELRIARVCRVAASAPERPKLPSRALAACWLDRDCPSKQCDRGACQCASAADCQVGTCEHGYCSEARP